MPRQLLMISMLLIVTFLGFGIIIPILPELVSAAHLSFMLAIYSAMSFLMSPFWGALSDRIGRRPVILTGILGFSISFFIFGMAHDQLVWMYISRVLGGMFSGAVISCAVAYVADVTTDENRTKGMGLVGMSIGLGFIFGPAIGGLLSYYSYSVPFFVSAALALILFLVVLRYLEESLTDRKAKQPTEKKRSRWVAFHGPMKYLYVLGFLVSFTLAGLETVFMYFQQDRIGAGSVEFGMMMLISGIVGALIQGGIVRRYIQQGEEGRYIVFGLLLSAVGFFLILLSNSFMTASIYLSVFTAGNSFIRPCVTSLITQKTKVAQGLATGLSSSMDSLGRILGPLLGAATFYIGMNLPFALGGIICIASVGLIYRFQQLDRLEVTNEPKPGSY